MKQGRPHGSRFFFEIGLSETASFRKPRSLAIGLSGVA